MATTHAHNLSRPFSPRRLRIYIGSVIFLGVFWLVMTLGPEFRIIPATFTVDVIANMIFTIPFVFLPLICLWNSPNENRTGLEKSAELVLVYLPLTAASQITYELPFLIGHLFDIWNLPLEYPADPGWKWFFWQYAMADTRYWGSNPYIFGIEFAAVMAGVAVFFAWLKLIRTDLGDEERIRNLWVSMTGIAMLFTCTIVYFSSEARTGFASIGQGLIYGLGFKFIFMNLAMIVSPPFVMYAIYQQIDFLTRKCGAVAFAGEISAEKR